jgi:hypothetical protein
MALGPRITDALDESDDPFPSLFADTHPLPAEPDPGPLSVAHLDRMDEPRSDSKPSIHG